MGVPPVATYVLTSALTAPTIQRLAVINGIPEEAAILAMRADLMAQLRLAVEKREWTQVEAAKVLGVSQSRVSDLMRGKWDKFSLDMLVTLATRAGLHCLHEVLREQGREVCH